MSIVAQNIPRFGTYKEACNLTGLSQWFLKRGVADGSIPHIKTGTKTMINLPMLIEMLDMQSLGAGGADGN